MMEPLRAVLLERRPHVIVTDFATFAGMDLAEELGITMVANVAGPVKLIDDALCTMDWTTLTSCFGLHIGRGRLEALSLLTLIGLGGLDIVAKKLLYHIRRGKGIWLVNSIWGLEKPHPLPPNVVVTGPVLPPVHKTKEKLQKDFPEIFEFLRKSESRGGALYISMGSLVKLHPWQIEVFYEAVKKAGVRAIWSLADELQAHLPKKDDPDVLVKGWMPQVEIIHDDAVMAVVTHCGWGGTLECLEAGKPIVSLPFFGDQPVNAKLLASEGVGEIGAKRLPPATFGSENRYSVGDITTDFLASQILKVMQTPSYKDNALRMKRYAESMGGVEVAVRQVEIAARCGVEHLACPSWARHLGGNPFTGALLGICLCLAGIAALLGGLVGTSVRGV